MTQDQYYTIDEVAKMLKVAYLTVYRWVRAGKLIAIKAGKQHRISKTALEEYINKGK